MRPDKTLIDKRFKESIDAWVLNAYPPGNFLSAVLVNNLKESVGRADEAALDNLPHVVAYLYADCPAACWGSPQKVAAWDGLTTEQAEEWCRYRDRDVVSP